MSTRPAVILRASEIAARALPYTQRLNPRSRFLGTELARAGGLARIGLSWATLPAGHDSFAYHAHDLQDEWMFVLSGRGVALVDDVEHEVAAGDFLAFPAPQVPHLLTNPGPEPLVYLMGGERPPMDVLRFPRLGRRCLLRREGDRAAFYTLPDPEFPFGGADE